MNKRIKQAVSFIRRHPMTLVRVASQIAFWIFAPSLFASAFAGVKNIADAMKSGTPIVFSGNIRILLLLLIFTLLFGRVFCGTACAFGAMGDFVYFLFSKLLKRKKRITPPHWLKYIKYVVLIAVFALCATGHQAWLQGKSPWDAFALLLAGKMPSDEYRIAIVILGLLLIGMAMIPRFFCRYLCPMGALFSILPPSLLVRIRKPTQATQAYKACGNCSLCSKQCPVGLNLSKEEELSGGECIGCLRCTETCYQKKPHLTLFGRTVKTTATAAFLSLLLFALAIIGSIYI